MKNLTRLTILILVLFQFSCNSNEAYRIEVTEVSPWCILGFDALDRTPKERIAMLNEMGFSKYGFNKGKGDLTTMIEEFKLAREHDIEITSIFLWLNSKRDSIGTLSPSNQELLGNLKKVGQKPTIWVSLSNNFFEGKTHQESLEVAVEMIRFIKGQADEVGSELALYNHRGWFGNPHHQIEILNQLKDKSRFLLVKTEMEYHTSREIQPNDFQEPLIRQTRRSCIRKFSLRSFENGDGKYDQISFFTKAI